MSSKDSKYSLIKLLVAPFLLTLMFGLMFFSARGDSNIVDEIAHIPAGYSYLTTGDYRLNPEHPPIIKDLAVIPLLFMHVNFPYDYWASNNEGKTVNNQWMMGWRFIYESGNNPDAMILATRIPIMLLSLLTGFIVYRWAKKLYGQNAAYFALFLYVLDANIIAHSRFVTTDLGITAALVIHLYILWKFIRSPRWNGLIFAGLSFGFVMVAKFSAAILAPIYGLIFLYVVIKNINQEKSPDKFFNNFSSGKWQKRFWGYFSSFAMIVLIGVFLTWVVYAFHIINMPVQVQHDLITEAIPYSEDTKGILNILHKTTDNPVLRPMGHYLLGFTMVASHVNGGHDAFLAGQSSNKGWWYYYPVAFLIKTPIPTMIFMVLAVVLWKRFKTKDFFDQFYLLVPPLVLLGMGMQGSLNLGIRYMLPVYPFIFISVAKMVNIIDFKALKNLTKKSLPAIGFTLLLVWYALSNFFIYPSYLSYFNESIGGPKNGYKWLIDSNVDWGQDVKRLSNWVDKEGIDKIYVDVFPGPMPAKYYMEDKMVEWHVQNFENQWPEGYLAVSETFFQNSRLKTKQGVEKIDYSILDGYKPIAQIGYSILIYKLPAK
ncbi:hypothetical protein AUK11_02525 [bacterium CG2_30_37_16]|nr:MAG: hypothetical protein AUK11_02525 [bacterium CG2_30_37_16]PJB06880.1 MAG: hypothetical protein CO123_01225 [bacterium (Candidatus Howlettbacteria) CG_4_9_14_3_um_filter_37_10]